MLIGIACRLTGIAPWGRRGPRPGSLHADGARHHPARAAALATLLSLASTAPALRAGEARTCEPPRSGSAISGPALARPEQREREARILQLLAHPRVTAAEAAVRALYAADPQGATEAGRDTIPRAAASITAAAASYAIAEAEARHPFPFWGTNAPHAWMGLDVPRSGYGIDNPDNVYRQAMFEGGGRYEIAGRVRAPGPVEQHFQLAGSIPGMGPMTNEGAALIGQLRSDQLRIDPDGGFCITVDVTPADGRPNHLQIPATGTVMLHVRDLFTDWGAQRPVWLDIRRVPAPGEAPAVATPDLDALAERTAVILAAISRYWVDYDNQFVYSRPANESRPPRVRPAGRGLSTGGHFLLGDDEALLVTVDALGAGSFGIQLTDPWGVAYDYVTRTSSLNLAQARPGEDGIYSFVISRRDPGVHNWLDPEGHGAGIFTLRWQALPAGFDPARAIRGVERVRLAELPDRLPAAARISPAERRAQQGARAAAHDRRLRL